MARLQMKQRPKFFGIAKLLPLYLVALAPLITLFSLHYVFAIGGNGNESSKQVSADSKACQDDITTASRTYLNTRVQKISACLTAYVACDQEADSDTAKACRAALVVSTTGLCAEGNLDSG